MRPAIAHIARHRPAPQTVPARTDESPDRNAYLSDMAGSPRRLLFALILSWTLRGWPVKTQKQFDRPGAHICYNDVKHCSTLRSLVHRPCAWAYVSASEIHPPGNKLNFSFFCAHLRPPSPHNTMLKPWDHDLDLSICVPCTP